MVQLAVEFKRQLSLANTKVEFTHSLSIMWS